MISAIYKVEDIFQDIPGDEKNVIMQIPPEIQKQMGWVEGDVLKITVREDRSIMIEKSKDANG